VTSEEVANGKPAPDIFLLAAGALPVMVPDLVQPTEDIRAFCRVYPDLARAREVFRSCGIGGA